MKRVALLVQYDGSHYSGWQKQKNATTVQEILEIALFKITNHTVKTFAAGRTDAGVHAKGQTASFELEKYIDTDTIRDGLNHHLRPHPIAIISSEKVNPDFNARFSAKLRWYEYKVINRRPPLTLDKNRAWCVHKDINIDKSIEQSKFFIGKHDLSAFRSINCQSKTPVKSINSIDIKKNKEEINFVISAKSFLHSQVRIMVGTLIDIGLDKISKSVSEIIELKKRDFAGVTAPAHGLYLTKIDY